MPAASLNIFPVAPAAAQPGVAQGANVAAGAGAVPTGAGAAAGFHAMVASIFGAVTVGDTAAAAKPAAAGDAPKTGKTDKADEAEAPGPGADAQGLVASLFFAAPAATQPTTPQPAASAVAETVTPGLEGKAASAVIPGLTPETPQEGQADLPAADDGAADPKGQRLALGQEAAAAAKAATTTAPAQAPAAASAAAAQPQAPVAAEAPPAAPAATPQTAALATAEAQAEAVQAEPVPLPAAPGDKSKAAPRIEPGQTAAAALDQAPPADAEQAPRPLTPLAAANPKVADKPAEGPPLTGAAEPDVARRAEAPRAPDIAPQAAAAAPAVAPPPQHTATAVVRGAPETVASLAADIVKKLDGQSSRFDVQLDPAGLGKVDVRIEIGAQGRLSATLTFDNPQAAAELRGRSGELHRALEQAGFDTSGGLSFSSGDNQGQSGQFLAQQQQQQGDSGGWRGRAFQAALNTAGEASDEAIANSLQFQRRTDTGVDIRI